MTASAKYLQIGVMKPKGVLWHILDRDARVTFLSQSFQWRTQGGEWGGGPDPPTFQKVGPRDSHKNAIKLVGGGGRADLSRSGL